jgi:hypothetical protein
MRSASLFAVLAALLALAVVVGSRPSAPQREESAEEAATPAAPRELAREEPRDVDESVPHIGSLEVLNGCGVDNAADSVAAFLRTRGFDVKNVDNAPSWNYAHTIVASRTKDMENARRAAKTLGTNRVILLRTDESMYDVVVFVGRDFRERIR